MSVIPTKPGDRMAASTWESKKSEQDAGAGNTFAALFGAAWTQQMQQTRASQDQRMVADTGGSPVADVSRRNDDAMMREQNSKLSSGVRTDNRPAAERPAQADGAADNASASAKNESTAQQGNDAQQRGEMTARKRDADNPNSDAAIARRLARQQRPGTQSGSSSQTAAMQSRQALDARNGASISADDAAGDAVSAGGMKTKKSAHASSASAALDGDASVAKADNDPLQTQRAVSAADADSKSAIHAATSSDSAVDAAIDATLKSNGTANASATGSGPDDLLAASRSSSASLTAASNDARAQTALNTPASDAAALSAVKASAQTAGGTDGAPNSASALTAQDEPEATAVARGTAHGLGTEGSSTPGKGTNSASRLLGAGDGSTALKQINSAAGNATSNTAIGTDTLRQRTSEAAMLPGKTVDPRDVSQNPALSSPLARTGADGGFSLTANVAANGVANGVANSSANNVTSATANGTSAPAVAASANASALSANGTADAARKSDDSKLAAGSRNRASAGISATGSASGVGVIANATGTPTDTRMAIEQATASNTANSVPGGQTGTALPIQNPTPLPAQTAAETSADAASDSAGSASGTPLQNNGSLLSAAAADGLNAFQRIAAQDDAPRLVMSTPITDPGFADELYDTVKLVSTRGLQSVEINIAPAELGPIKLRVDMSGNEADVRFEATNETTRSLLADAVPALKEQLAQSGIDLRHATVDRNTAWNGNSQGNLQGNLGQGAGQSGNQGNNAGNSAGGQQTGNGRFDTGAGNVRAEAGNQQPAQRRRNALLDTYA